VAPQVEPGDALLLGLPGVADGPSVRARVRELDGETLTVRAPECPFQPGDVVRIDVIVPADARYMAEARVRANRQDVVTLTLLGAWDRIQRREFFRIRTASIAVTIVRERARRSERDLKAKSFLYDLSAGGAFIETTLPLEDDELVQLKMSLPIERIDDADDPDAPRSVEVDVPSRVVRVVDMYRGRRRRVGLKFGALPANLRADILRWVYALQSKRRSRELDAAFDDFE
jgi:c-di-GMP-binding flagellar brake protein YcgR